MATYAPKENQNIPRRERIVRGRQQEKPAGWTPPNSQVQVDPLALGPDVKLRWVRRFVSGKEEDNRGFFKRIKRGWVPVTPEELPEFNHLRDPETGHLADNGCILCKIDARLAQADVEFWEDQALGGYEKQAREFADTDVHGSLPKSVEVNSQKKLGFRGKRPA